MARRILKTLNEGCACPLKGFRRPLEPRETRMGCRRFLALCGLGSLRALLSALADVLSLLLWTRPAGSPTLASSPGPGPEQGLSPSLLMLTPRRWLPLQRPSRALTPLPLSLPHAPSSVPCSLLGRSGALLLFPLTCFSPPEGRIWAGDV